MIDKHHSFYAEKKAVVIGTGVSGQAACRLLLALGARVTVIDEKPDSLKAEFAAFMKAHEVAFIGEALSPHHFDDCHIVITSPGVPYTRLANLVDKSLTRSAKAQKPVIMAETDLALQFVSAPVVAITGTSGKTTTVSLCEAMLTAAGKKVFLGGNIGTPLSDFVLSGEEVDVIVLELSSFQLQGCTHLHAKTAAILNLNPNHLDQHTDMEEYTTAKFAIFNNQTQNDSALLPSNLSDEFQRRGGKARVIPLTRSMNFQLDYLQGEHNAINAETAYLATKDFGVSEALAREVAQNFKPLAHRLEHVGKAKGVHFINDSKSTTVDSLRVALQSFDKGIVLLAGGKFKGGDLLSLMPLMKDKVKAVALYGGSRSVFEEAWNKEEKNFPLVWHESMDEAFTWALSQTSQGDVVLLSPATASYDQFPNYIERGKHFCQLVKGLS